MTEVTPPNAPNATDLSAALASPESWHLVDMLVAYKHDGYRDHTACDDALRALMRRHPVLLESLPRPAGKSGGSPTRALCERFPPQKSNFNRAHPVRIFHHESEL